MPADKQLPKKSFLTPKQVLEICRTNVEALHNLHYLMEIHVTDPARLSIYLKTMQDHLQKMTDELCRKPELNEAAAREEC